jgi:hypothetical protein
MNIRTGLLLLTLAISAPATAELITVTRAVEASASNLNVPTTANERLTFRPCQGFCEAEYISVRLTPNTRYTVNNKSTNFTEFRKAFFSLPRDKDAYALVTYDAKSNTATSVKIAG